jgi:hypothetical protein
VNPRVGPTSFSRATFLNFVPHYFKAVGVAAHDLCGMLRRIERLMKPSHAVVPTEWLPRGGSHRGQGNHDHDS